jgi:hypothetical protein
MVKVIEYQKRKNADGKEFFALIIMGAIEFIKSSISGNYYATAWKTSITSTFNEDVCQSLVGKAFPGMIEKVTVEPYEFKVPSSGETLMLTHKYRFNPEPNSPSMEEVVFTPEIVEA